MFASLRSAPLAYLIILATVVCSIRAFTRSSFFDTWRMHPYSVYRGKRMSTVLTSLLVHVDGMHLLINGALLCLTLPEVEYMLVDDFGTIGGRCLFVLFTLFTAVFAGTLTAIQNRHRIRHWSAGSSALIMAMLLYFLVYFPVEPLTVDSSLLPPWKPVWLALGILALLLAFVFFKIPASAIHLYGAVAGILFAFATRPQALNEMVELICPFVKSEKGDNESTRYNHTGKYPVSGSVEKGTFAAFATLNGIRLLKVKAVHPLGNHQRCKRFCVRKHQLVN